MSLDRPAKKRCLVKRLDFENCVVSGYRDSSGRKRRLRARITRDPDGADTPNEGHTSTAGGGSPILLGSRDSASRPIRTGNGDDAASPVLYSKVDASPQVVTAKSVRYRSKRKIDFGGETSLGGCLSPPSSPVFRVARTTKPDAAAAATSSSSTTTVTADDEDSSRIDDTTQTSAATALSVRISSIESVDFQSPEMENDSAVPQVDDEDDDDNDGDAVVDEKRTSAASQRKRHQVDDGFPARTDGRQNNRQTSRKNFKKNGLLSRLRVIQQKQASEKLLWQHRRRGDASDAAAAETLSVTGLWTVGEAYVATCEPDTSYLTYLIVDGSRVPAARRLRPGVSVQIRPPWQKIAVGETTKGNVYLNPMCLEITGEVAFDPTATTRRQRSTSDSGQQELEPDRNLFHTLFRYHISPFLY